MDDSKLSRNEEVKRWYLEGRIIDDRGQLPVEVHEDEDERQAQQVVQEHHGKLIQLGLAGRQAANLSAWLPTQNACQATQVNATARQ